MKNILLISVLIFINWNFTVAKTPALLEPPDGRVYHGVQMMTFEDTKDPLAGYLSVINDTTIQPAVRGLFMSIPGERGPDKSLTALIKFFHTADSVGFIPELSLFFVGKTSATDSIIAVSNEYDWIIDSVITTYKKYGKKMFLRLGGEFNGSGPGWNGGGYHPYLYVKMFKKIVDKFTAKGLRDSIAVNWCYEPDAANDFDSVDSRGARWYPGDEYVDWFGLDVFDAAHFDQSLPDGTGRNITKKGKSERFLAMARAKGKPVYMSETSAKGVNISNNPQDGINDWKAWFAKFFEFIAAHKEIKGYGYIDANWPAGAYPNWGDARIEKNQYITNKYIEEMKKPQYIHLKSKLTPDPFSATPLTEMGKSLYKDFAGGLYPVTQNQRPIDHNNAGIELANTILSLDSEVLPDKNNGKIVLLSIGMSNTTQEFSKFMNLMDTFQFKNSKLVIVDGAQGGQTASIIKDPNAMYWKIIDTARLPQKNVTNKQVQAVWLKQANAGPTQQFPLHANMLQDDLAKIVQLLVQKFPNLKIVYLSSRIYGGYATTQLNPEPYAFESGFAVKWLIEDQINGNVELDYKGTPKKAPWLAWGPYLWANGAKPREADGLVWLKEDFGNDGTHPTDLGRMKVAKMLLDFFRTDETSKPWFLEKEVSVQDNTSLNSITVFPNPAVNSITISKRSSSNSVNELDEIQIYNTFGKCLMTYKSNQLTTQTIDVSGFVPGIYLVRTGNTTCIFIKQ